MQHRAATGAPKTSTDVILLLGATILSPRTTQKVSSFRRCSTVVCGSAASSKHSLMRERSAMASVASCRPQVPKFAGS